MYKQSLVHGRYCRTIGSLGDGNVHNTWVAGQQRNDQQKSPLGVSLLTEGKSKTN